MTQRLVDPVPLPPTLWPLQYKCRIRVQLKFVIKSYTYYFLPDQETQTHHNSRIVYETVLTRVRRWCCRRDSTLGSNTPPSSRNKWQNSEDFWGTNLRPSWSECYTKCLFGWQGHVVRLSQSFHSSRTFNKILKWHKQDTETLRATFFSCWSG